MHNTSSSGLRVAIVGTGPSACYAAHEVLLHDSSARVTMLDKLLTPYGLVRAGVAPDHQETKRVTDLFRTTLRSSRVHTIFGVEVGHDVTHSTLLETHHAVIYAVGASEGRSLGIPGEHLPGSHPASDFVGWYNGHPDCRDLNFDLSDERVVVVGNGNVSLDVARILTTPIERLLRTDIPDYALDALAASKVREVILLGRRGPAQSAYTNSEFIGLTEIADLKVEVDTRYPGIDDVTLRLAYEGDNSLSRFKASLARRVSESAPQLGRRRIIFRYLASPIKILGDSRVDGLEVGRNILIDDLPGPRAAPSGHQDVLSTRLVLRSVGHRGRLLPSIPFDQDRGVIPNIGGRVIAEDSTGFAAGCYVAGWIKRGPSGVIGTNKRCAAETVASMLEDFRAGRLREPLNSEPLEIEPRSGRAALGLLEWNRIDRAERDEGVRRGRPRVKLTTEAELRFAAEASLPISAGRTVEDPSTQR